MGGHGERALCVLSRDGGVGVGVLGQVAAGVLVEVVQLARLANLLVFWSRATRSKRRAKTVGTVGEGCDVDYLTTSQEA